MIAPRPRGRSGITLTEILISILIMGIGLISLATLFPLGLIRLRDAERFQRGSLLVQSATDDVDARNLLLKSTFVQTWYGNQDPFTSDLVYGGFKNPVQTNIPGNPQPGLPVVYDPLWRAVTNIVPPSGNLTDQTLDFKATYAVAAAEARFGAGVIVTGTSTVSAFNLRTNAPGDGGSPSAYGLQRISNFIPWSNAPFTAPKQNYTPLYPFTYYNKGLGGNQASDVAGDVFTSIDDVVFNSTEGATRGASPLVPDLTLSLNKTPMNDWRYTWFFTGRQVDSTNGTMFQGDMVICDARPFAFGPLPAPNAATSVPFGESVVEAIFGYSQNVSPLTGFAVGADRTVLLRWPTSIADPVIRNGSWIADVTYERDQATSNARILATQTPFQRCNWYQVVKRNDAQADPDFSGYRRMIVTINSPVRAKTALSAGGLPVFVNVAVIMPSVIYVYPRSFTIH